MTKSRDAFKEAGAATVDGHDATFLLDTGEDINFLQSDRAQVFGVGALGRQARSGGRWFELGARLCASARCSFPRPRWRFTIPRNSRAGAGPERKGRRRYYSA